MVFDFYPWKIEVDVEKTRKFYEENDYSFNKEWNNEFVALLNPVQKDFFNNLGIDFMKIEIEKHDFVDNEEVPYNYLIHFLICGRFLSMPKEQLDVYSDEEVFGNSIDWNSVESIETDKLVVYDGLGFSMGIRFKHPAIHFEDKQFEEWDCGFVAGAFIVRGQ